MKESLKKAQDKYNQKCRLYNIRINTETEKDLLAWMQEGHASSRIKKLIREDIERRQQEQEESRIIKLKNGVEIVEKRSNDEWKTYDYYINDRFQFGTMEPFPEDWLQNLFDTGYFDI